MKRLFYSVTGAGLFVVTACSTSPAVSTRTFATAAVSATPAPTLAPTPIEFTVEDVSFSTEDDVTLSGTLYDSQGEVAVVLAHMSNSTQKSWQPFAELSAGHGFTALTFNFRGYAPSKGSPVQEQISLDTRAAVEFLQARGFQRIVCVGASMGGTACMRTALDLGLSGLAVVSSPPTMGGATSVAFGDIARLEMPKLFVVAEDDSGFAALTETMYSTAVEPKQLKVFPGPAHGTELFDSPAGGEFRDLLLGFLDGVRAAP